MLDFLQIDNLIANALREDMPLGDITTDNTVAADAVSSGVFIAKQTGILAGLEVAERVFRYLDANVEFNGNFPDGVMIKTGDIIGQVRGNARALLKAERTALNLLQRLSGIATKTYEFSEKIKDLPAKVVDTRKTTPGLRYLEKYAVRVGGGQNHRFCLSDGVLIKDNHIKAAGNITSAVEMVRKGIPHTIKIEVETETLKEVEEALKCNVDIIMLDNMSIDMMKTAVGLINKRALVEASGNVNLDVIRDIALTGVDIISVGELTHTVKAFDISLKFK